MRSFWVSFVVLALSGCGSSPVIIANIEDPYPGNGTVCPSSSVTILAKYTIVNSGLYGIAGHTSLGPLTDQDPNGFFTASVRVNGGILADSITGLRQDTNVDLQVNAYSQLKIGDIVELITYNHSNSSLPTKGSNLTLIKFGN
jgi:hypothetical protein